LKRLAKVISYFDWMNGHVSPLYTEWKLLQFFPMPDWMGVGIVTPLDG
jgi:hypothetical protein